MAPRKLGVGVVHSPPLHELLRDSIDLIDVIEIEPQTGWATPDPIRGPFRPVLQLTSLWEELPQPKLIHSVGMPLAGTRRPSPEQASLLRDLARSWGCSYISDHLSVGGTPHENAGFLLPPCQTDAGIANAVRNITELSSLVGLPVAIETGVSYLPRYTGEIEDGDFVAAIAQQADCGILFDVHNIYCNERNGRQHLLDFAAALPADRVWEMHVAGGLELDGYWLDAHSGRMPADLVAAATEIARGLPNLSAIIFEVLPSFLSDDAETVVRHAVDEMRGIWEAAGKAQGDGMPALLRRDPAPQGSDQTELSQWEENLLNGMRLSLPAILGEDFSASPAIALYGRLAHSFRASALARLLPRSLRLLAGTGQDIEPLIITYEVRVAAPLFAINEAEAFAAWLIAEDLVGPLTRSVLQYELALVRVPLDGAPITVNFPGDPRPLFNAITEARTPPRQLEGAPWAITITPDEAARPALSSISS